MCCCCFRFYKENYLYAVKVNNFGHMHYLTPWFFSGQFHMFLTYVIKVDKREVPRLNFEHNYVLLFFSVFPGKLPLCHKSE